MKKSHCSAFTLLELLVVVAIIGVLSAVVVPVYGSVQTNARRSQSLAMLKSMTTAALAYAGDNSGSLPGQGDQNPGWGDAAATTPAETDAWYNILPRNYAATRGLGDYAAKPALFYTKDSMFYVPAAPYPATKLTAPQFAFALNSKLYTSSQTSVRLSLITLPAQTVLFQECGLVGEKTIKGQKAYTNQAYSYASRTAARYNGQTVLAFIDGHADAYTGTSVVDPSSGKAYFAPYPNAFPTGAATVYWEADPTVTPN